MVFGKKHTTIVNIEATVNWQVARNPATGHYLGVCQELNLNAVGDTWAKFQASANDVLQLLFIDLWEDGDLSRFLRDRGWHLRTEIQPGHQPVFDVPYETEQVPQEMLV